MTERKKRFRMSVIIPVLNGAATLGLCLESLIQQKRRPDEVIVVDNGSVDDTPSIAKGWALAHSKLVCRIVSERKRGPAAARNRGAQEAKGDVVVFLDADCTAEPEWLKRIEEEFQRGYVAVGGTYGGYLPGHWMEKYIHAARSSFLGERTVLSQVSLQGAFLVGANAAFDRKLFREIGGYHEDFLIGEDFELSARLIHHGSTLLYHPGIRVTHHSRTGVSHRLRRNFWGGVIEVYTFQQYGARKGQIRFFPGTVFEIPSRWRFYLDVGSPLTLLLFLGVAFKVWGKGAFPLALLLFLFFFLRFGWILRKGGEPVRAMEIGIMIFFWLAERACLEGGRCYGSLRYGILYL